MDKPKKAKKKAITCPKCGHGWETATMRPRAICSCGANIAVPGNENNPAPKDRKGNCYCPKCGNRWTPKTKNLKVTCTWCYKTIRRKKVGKVKV